MEATEIKMLIFLSNGFFSSSKKEIPSTSITSKNPTLKKRPNNLLWSPKKYTYIYITFLMGKSCDFHWFLNNGYPYRLALICSAKPEEMYYSEEYWSKTPKDLTLILALMCEPMYVDLYNWSPNPGHLTNPLDLTLLVHKIMSLELVTPSSSTSLIPCFFIAKLIG